MPNSKSLHCAPYHRQSNVCSSVNESGKKISGPMGTHCHTICSRMSQSEVPIWTMRNYWRIIVPGAARGPLWMPTKHLLDHDTTGGGDCWTDPRRWCSWVVSQYCRNQTETGRTTAQQLSKVVEAATGPHQFALSTKTGCKTEPSAFDHTPRKLTLTGLSCGCSVEYLWENDLGTVHWIPQGEAKEGEEGDTLMPLMFSVGQHQALEQWSCSRVSVIRISRCGLQGCRLGELADSPGDEHLVWRVSVFGAPGPSPARQRSVLFWKQRAWVD